MIVDVLTGPEAGSAEAWIRPLETAAYQGRGRFEKAISRSGLL